MAEEKSGFAIGDTVVLKGLADNPEMVIEKISDSDDGNYEGKVLKCVWYNKQNQAFLSRDFKEDMLWHR